MPFTNREHAAHPAFPENIAKLRSWGVTVLFGRRYIRCTIRGPAAVTWTCSHGRKQPKPSMCGRWRPELRALIQRNDAARACLR
jgi:hypothetical protein